VLVSFPDSANAFRHPEKVIITGNPVRKEFISAVIGDHRGDLGYCSTDFVVLVVGGSLGAYALNQEILRMVPRTSQAGIKLLFITGKRYYGEMKSALEGVLGKDSVRLIDYAENMPALIAASDVVISRAGALALAEIAVCGKASVLVPSPNVTNDHQYHNAQAFEKAGAAIIVRESELTEETSVLADRLLRLKNNKQKLNSMSQAAFLIGRSDAADIIYEALDLHLIRTDQI